MECGDEFGVRDEGARADLKSTAEGVDPPSGRRGVTVGERVDGVNDAPRTRPISEEARVSLLRIILIPSPP